MLGAALLTAYAFDLDRFIAGLGLAGGIGILLIVGAFILL